MFVQPTRWVIALGMGLAMLSPGMVAGAHASAAAPVDDIVLEVEVDPRMLQAEAHRGWVEEHARAVLEQRASELEPGDGIAVGLAGTSRNYRVTIRVLRDGEPLTEQPEAFECKESTDELLALVDARIDQAIDGLVEVRAEEQAERERAAEERERADREAKAEQEQHNELAARSYRPAKLGVAGAVTMGLGGALAVAGAVVTAEGRQPSDNDLLGPTDFRPPGYALLGAGSVVLTTGLILLVVDVVRCKKDRVACSERGRTRQRVAGRNGEKGWVRR